MASAGKRNIVTAQMASPAGQSAIQASDVASLEKSYASSEQAIKPLKILVAGGGIGGLVFALAAKKRGINVEVRFYALHTLCVGRKVLQSVELV